MTDDQQPAEPAEDTAEAEAAAVRRRVLPMTSREREAAQRDLDRHWPRQNRYPRP